MGATINDQHAFPNPADPSQGTAKKTKQAKGFKGHGHAAQATTPGATPADHVDKGHTGPMTAGEDTLHKSSATSAKNVFKAAGKQVMSHGGAKGALMFKPLASILRTGTLPFIRGAFQPVEANQPPLGKKQTLARMFYGGCLGGLTGLFAAGIPCGIIGIAMTASGPGAIPIFAAIAAVAVYCMVAGAYQGYKSSRPAKDPTVKVEAKYDGSAPMTVTAEAEPRRVNAERIGKVTLPAPQTTVSATDATRARRDDSGSADGGQDADAAVTTAAAETAAAAGKHKDAEAQGLSRQADHTVSSERQAADTNK